jgi:two-component system sensor histidine kinase KdpD
MSLDEATEVQAYQFLTSVPGCAASHLRKTAARLKRMATSLRAGEVQLRPMLAPMILYPLACVAVTTVLLSIAVEYAALEFDLVIYLVPVVVSAVRWGGVAAIVAVCTSAAVVDYLLIPPVYTFVIDDPRQAVELALFVFVALVTSHLAGRLRSHVDTLRRRDHEIENLYEFSRRLASCTTAGDLLSAIQDHLSVHLGCKAHLIHLAGIHAGRDREGDERVPQSIVREATDMVMARQKGSRLVTERETDALWALKYIATSVAGHGVLAVKLGKSGGRGMDNEHSDAVLSGATAMLTRIDAAAALAKANIRLESETLQAALIDTASHELRSLVAAILGSASVLDQVPALRDDEKLRSLVDGMHHEAERLHTDIQNLLDTVRITDAGIRLRREWTDLADILSAAIRQRMRRTAAHRLTVNVDAKLPLVNVDPVLIEQAAGQLIENAAKYSPAGSEIAIVAGIEEGHVVLSVTDTGAGLTAEEADNLFQRAWRGRRHIGNLPGLGLGLWIARIFVAANGGTLAAHSPGPGMGTTMSIYLPLPATLAPQVQFDDVQAG